MSGVKKHRVAITVFAEVEVDSEVDAEAFARYAIRQVLRDASIEEGGMTIQAETRWGDFRVRITQVMETGNAAGNGYLWIAPTPKAYRQGGVE